MTVYVLRHAIAEDGHAGQPDSARALTSPGRKKLGVVLDTAARAGVAPSIILTSPYVRAKQTAKLAAESLVCETAPIETKALTPAGTPKAIWDEIRVHRSEEEVMVVGHEPLLSQLVNYLLGAPGLIVDMKKAAMVSIAIEGFRGDPRGVLQWMLTPKLVS